MVSSVCGGNQVRSTKTSMSYLQSSMVVVVSWSGAAWVLPALGNYNSLRETMNANMYCDITEAEHDPFPSETGPQGSIPTWQRPQTHLQNYHFLAKEADGKGNLVCAWSHHTGTWLLLPFLYADDTQLYLSFRPYDPTVAARISDCWQTYRHGWKNITYSAAWQRLSFLSSLPLQLYSMTSRFS